jgi:quercetin dioxygenase-like cupin family protein
LPADRRGAVIGHDFNVSSIVPDRPPESVEPEWHDPVMEKISLTALARQQLNTARSASSGRSAHTVYGGHEHALRQTLIALAAGSALDEHESPGEATLQVIQGRVSLANAEASWEGSPGDHIVVPRSRHSLHALEDSVVLLTVVKPVGPHA